MAKVAFVLAAMALLAGAASAQTLRDCRVDMGYTNKLDYKVLDTVCIVDPFLDNCGKCDCFYSNEAQRTLCRQCVINLRGTGSDLSDCWNPTDDGLLPFLDGVYDKCRTKRCFDCVTNFKLKSDPKLDLCKMVEPAYSDPVQRGLAFDCLSNTQGDSKPGFKWFKNIFNVWVEKSSNELRTSPCIQIKPQKGGDKQCTKPECFYCLTNFAGVADEAQRWAKWEKCQACQADSNFWGCVYGK